MLYMHRAYRGPMQVNVNYIYLCKACVGLLVLHTSSLRRASPASFLHAAAGRLPYAFGGPPIVVIRELILIF